MRMRKMAGWFLRSDEPKAQRARWITKLAIVLGMLIALFWIVPVRSVIQALQNTDPILFIIGVAVVLVKMVFTAMQMKPLLENQKIDRSLTQIYKINLAVRFYLLLLPTTIIASGYRWYRFAEPEGKRAESLVALAFYRLFKTFLTLTLGLGFLLLSMQQISSSVVVWIVLLLLLIILIWVAITRYSNQIYSRIRNRLGFILDRAIMQPVSQIIEKLMISASSFSDMPMQSLLFSMSAGIASDLIAIVSNLFLARAVGLSLSYLELGWVTAIVNLTTQITLSIMEGLGVREVTLVAVLSIFNISAEQALAYSFLIFSRSVIISLIGGAIEALDTLRSRRKNKLDAVQSENKEI